LTLADPRPVARDWADHGGEVHPSADRTLVLFPTDCLMATWRTESTQAVFLNRQPTVGAGAERVCGEDPSLRIVFAGGDEVTYRIERTVLVPALPRAALIALAALVAVWYALARARRVPL